MSSNIPRRSGKTKPGTTLFKEVPVCIPEAVAKFADGKEVVLPRRDVRMPVYRRLNPKRLGPQKKKSYHNDDMEVCKPLTIPFGKALMFGLVAFKALSFLRNRFFGRPWSQRPSDVLTVDHVNDDQDLTERNAQAPSMAPHIMRRLLSARSRPRRVSAKSKMVAARAGLPAPQSPLRPPGTLDKMQRLQYHQQLLMQQQAAGGKASLPGIIDRSKGLTPPPPMSANIKGAMKGAATSHVIRQIESGMEWGRT